VIRRVVTKKEQGAKLVKARLLILGSKLRHPVGHAQGARGPVGHPTLVAINEQVGPLVQEYVRVAQKAARKLSGAGEQVLRGGLGSRVGPEGGGDPGGVHV